MLHSIRVYHANAKMDTAVSVCVWLHKQGFAGLARSFNTQLK